MNFKKTGHFFLAMCFLAIGSCKEEKNQFELSQTEKDRLIGIVDSMYALDQGTRHGFDKIDSIFGIENVDFLEIDNKHYKVALDSLWEITNKIDESNTRKLIAITKKHGFPSNERLGVYASRAYFIFVHSPREYFNEIRKLVNKEYKAGRMGEYERAYVFWHLDGRNGMPPMLGKDGEVVWVE